MAVLRMTALRMTASRMAASRMAAHSLAWPRIFCIQQVLPPYILLYDINNRIFFLENVGHIWRPLH